MCGTVIDGNRVKLQLGGQMPIGGYDKPGFWNGHAREENLDQWLSQGWEESFLPTIDNYTEGKPGVEFDVGDNEAIKIIVNPKKVFKNAHPFNIVTREASSSIEKSVHPRFPRTIKTKG